MDERQRNIIEKLAQENEEVKTLWENHQLFGKQIEKLESKPYRTPQEESEVKALKVQKLEGKTKLQILVESLL